MKVLVVFAAVVAAVAAFPQLSNSFPRHNNGQFVLTKDYSLEDGTEYNVKFVQPYTPGQPRPLFDPTMDSSEEVYRYLASQQARGRGSWADRVRDLKQVLDTGLDASDERYHRTYGTGLVNLPSDRTYFVDRSGEIYYAAPHDTKLQSGAGVQIVRK